jgi:ketosteroid isomerase-like protein
MNRVLLFPMLFILCVAVPSAQKEPAGSRTPGPAIMEKQLREADLDFAKQTAARRLDGWMDFFAQDASIIHDGKTVTGQEALRSFYEPIFANKDFTLTWSPTHAEAAKDGTLGYTYGNYEAKSGSVISHGMYTTVWRREKGRWKVVLDLGSSALPAETRPQN